mmetsp:Transcript_38048/g.120122  ORF Transcript_38048/g.120122 Transcript_38048/m.120122 type:complete len:175 (-) Transcript_38048:23-547(-)
MPGQGRYARLPSDEDESAERMLHRVHEEKEARSRVRDKFEALAWCFAAGAIIWYGDGRRNLWQVLLHSPKIHRGWFNAGCAFISCNVVIFLYLAVWLKHVRGNTAEWEVAAPLAIPISTAFGILATFALLVGLWGVWSFLTPFMMFALFMGFIMANHFLPSWLVGGGSDSSKEH